MTRLASAIRPGSRSVGGITVMGPSTSNGTGLTTVARNGSPVARSAPAQAGATPALSVPPKKHSTSGPSGRAGRRREVPRISRTLSRSST